MYSSTTIIGHLGAAPELKYLPSGKAVAELRVATGERWKNDAGEPQSRTEWWRCQVWEKRAEACARMLRKGSLVQIVGIVRTRKYTDKEGHDRYLTELHVKEITFLANYGEEDKGSGGGGESKAAPPARDDDPPAGDDDMIQSWRPFHRNDIPF